jgi:MoaA/NifB/PqqE/SkfB family radical SAM enzyme/SAM-dependent methyltransferase
MSRGDTMTTDYLTGYDRLSLKNAVLYVYGDGPDWITIPERSDLVIAGLKQGKNHLQCAEILTERYQVTAMDALREVQELASRFRPRGGKPAMGRRNREYTPSLVECWVHLTNRCNMACRHCMFSSSPAESQQELSRDLLDRVIEEALASGCQIFYFTGGEPFIYPDFTSVCDTILAHPDTHVVILTNLRDIEKHREWLAACDPDRVHLQVSLDGSEPRHDELRGRGAYTELTKNLALVHELGLATTLSVSVSSVNLGDLPRMPQIASNLGVKNIHCMWLFRTGNADDSLFVSPEEIMPALAEARRQSLDLGVEIDNFEILRAQLFSLPGTRFDLSNAGYQCLAIGPDGAVYPTPALVGQQDACAGSVAAGGSLLNILRESDLFQRLRSTSLLDSPRAASAPLRWLIGGGDIDHSFYADGTFCGDDPYLPLYEMMAALLLEEESSHYSNTVERGIYCRMGERLVDCSEDRALLNFTHSNCVLSIHGTDGHTPVSAFYSEAALQVKSDIINPVTFASSDLSHVPEKTRSRNYGCGSPVQDCAPSEGETIVDLGSGMGMECMIAARQVGSEGTVIGIDMSDEMLRQAEEAAVEVRKTLGYDNLRFEKGFLEEIPLPDKSVDAVISNCVINLSPDKRRTFLEVERVLKPGGRICISDIVSDREIPLDIQYNEKLRGECIGGALREEDLFGMLDDLGFRNLQVVKRFPYRDVSGYTFYSVTYLAWKKGPLHRTSLIYPGPFHGVLDEAGTWHTRGMTSNIDLPAGMHIDGTVLKLDDRGFVTNVEMECSCVLPTDGSAIEQSPLTYDGTVKVERMNNEIVEKAGQFIIQSFETDMACLFAQVRNLDGFPTFGPHHHPVIPAIVLSVYRNNGGEITRRQIETGIERGRLIPPASCSFLGVDGAAAGIAIAFSIILGANPYDGAGRHTVQKVAATALMRISEYEASRCCLRECWTALQVASELSEQVVGLHLPADESLSCTTRHLNQGCIGKRCPLFNG